MNDQYTTSEPWLSENGKRQPSKNDNPLQGNLFTGFTNAEMLAKALEAQLGDGHTWEKIAVTWEKKGTGVRVVTHMVRDDAMVVSTDYLTRTQVLSMLAYDLLDTLAESAKRLRLRGYT